jgi:hypothetical protein
MAKNLLNLVKDIKQYSRSSAYLKKDKYSKYNSKTSQPDSQNER